MSTPRRMTSFRRSQSAHLQTSHPSAVASAYNHSQINVNTASGSGSGMSGGSRMSGGGSGSGSGGIATPNSPAQRKRQPQVSVSPRGSMSMSGSASKSKSKSTYSDIIVDASGTPIDNPRPRSPQPFVAALSYNGLEVTLAASLDDDVHVNDIDNHNSNLSQPITQTSTITVILSRTRMTLQTLRVMGEVVGLRANHVNGVVSVATSVRKVYNFHPVATAPASNSEDGNGYVNGYGNADEQEYGNEHGNAHTHEHQIPVTAFGKYFWVRGRTVDCSTFFNPNVPFQIFSYMPSSDHGSGGASASASRTKNGTGNLPHVHVNATVHIASSVDYKLLIAHADQLAVFDIDPRKMSTIASTGGGGGGDVNDNENENDNDNDNANRNSHNQSQSHTDGCSTSSGSGSNTKTNNNSNNNRGEILWTTRVRATISCADISGDGRAIAYVLEGEGVGVPYPFGVRTYIRDKEDGSSDHGNNRSTNPRWQTPRGGSSSRPPLSSSSSSKRRDSTTTPSGKASSSSSPSPHRNKEMIRSGGITPPPIPTPKDENGVFQFPSWDETESERMVKTKTNSNSKHGMMQQNNNNNDHNNNNNNNAGIVYKSGPFLVHSTTVTRLSFRGLGFNHSNIYHDMHQSNGIGSVGNSVGGGVGVGIMEWNDLLLTSCSSDGSMRVIAQGSWKILLHWETPPGSRADWIHGVTMANLGDLDPFPKQSKRRNTNTSTKTGAASSMAYATNGNGHGNGDPHLQQQQRPEISPSPKITRNEASANSGWQSQPMPSCAAGAWISELTFRGPYPALRLSRLSFLKSGGDAWAPAHFESVAAILPPATILPQAVLHNLECMSMVVQGIWSAWNPWVAHPNGSRVGTVAEDETLSGNAMALLGSVPYGYGGSSSNSGYGYGYGYGSSSSSGMGMGELDILALGGTHSPPAELRLIAGHLGDKVVLMEFPLWGDTDFGAMELGSPLRYLMNLKDSIPKGHVPSLSSKIIGPSSSSPMPITVSTRCDCLDFESNILCAVVTEDRKNISLEWRKRGTMNIINRPDVEIRNDSSGNRSRSHSNVSIASTASVDSTQSYAYYESSNTTIGMEQFSDWSICPLPLSLPSLHLPVTCHHEEEKISLLKWWPDENFGGPPRLFALTTAGTLILYEMPPPWSAQEPIMPLDDSLTMNVMKNFSGDSVSLSDRLSHHSIDDDLFKDDEEDHTEEYDVHITPHVDFGLGLRLEAQADGMPAIAGSYKKHPLTGGRLPAERTGKIVLGDELIAVNSVSLEGLTFDEIISTVRDVGSSANDGELIMRFRALEKNRLQRENLSHHMMTDRVTLDEGLEVIHQRNYNDGDQASVLVGADAEMQQEFGRIVATIPNALPSYTSSPRSLVLLPWHYGEGAPVPYQTRGASLLVYAVGRTITASRMEVLNDHEVEASGKLSTLGSITLDDSESEIVSLVYIKTASDHWCVAACDRNGQVQLVFIDVLEKSESPNVDSPALKAEFRAYPIFNCNGIHKMSKSAEEYLVRAHSIEILGTMPLGGDSGAVDVWSSIPFVSNDRHEEEKVDDRSSYSQTKIFHRGKDRDPVPIVDFRWIAGGGVDAYPWLLTFSLDSAVVHQRSCLRSEWSPTAEIFYCSTKESCGESGIRKRFYDHSLTPLEAFPHLLSALRNVVNTTDEKKFLLSDWHPEAMISFLCAEPEGPRVAMTKQIKGIITWLSKWMDPDDAMTMHWDSRSRLAIPPFDSVFGLDDEEDDEADDGGAESAAALMQTLSVAPKQPSQSELLRQKLQDCIKKEILSEHKNHNEENGNKQHSKEFLLAMNTPKSLSLLNNDDSDAIGLPDPIKKFSPDELCFLWAMGELCSKPSKVKNMDRLAEVAMLSVSIMRQIEDSKYEDAPKSSTVIASPRFLTKAISSHSLESSTTHPKPTTIAPAACLAALLSDSQRHLLKACKEDRRWTWDIVQSLNIPFWLRSDDELKNISEEIAQTKYKETMDVVECALFYVITGNKRMLKTVAAADRKHSGRTFLQFLTKYDFSSHRGRTAAEKNAFSLLRKRKYGPAAAFFLLAEPPMLTSALNIIVTKMEDVALALFVSRLIKVNRISGAETFGNDLTIGGANSFSLRGLGGGGGFAAPMGQSMDIEVDEPEEKYSEWTPNLPDATKDLLESRALPGHVNDPCSQCLDLLWLNRPNDAAMCLLGTSFTDHKTSSTSPTSCESLPSLFSDDMPVTSGKTYRNASARVISKANKIFDFVATPLIVEKMELPRHSKWFASLSVSRALYRRGIELPSMTLLPTLIAENESESEGDSSRTAISNPSSTRNGQTSAHESSSAGGQFTSESEQMTSSIFDSFQPSMPSKTTPKPPPADQMSSSIFDSFDMPSSKPKVTKPPSTGQMSSSIFDSFDVPPSKQKSKPPAASTSGQMTSSIFDSFDAPPPKQRPKASTTSASGQMTSSIFDSFDAPPPTKQKSKSSTASSSGQMTSSIFDSFDAPPGRQSKPSAASSSGQMTSSIFDSFDAVPTSSKNTSSAQASNSPVAKVEKKRDEVKDSHINNIPLPAIWEEWRVNTLTTCVARRLLREMARIINPLLANIAETPMALFQRHIHPLVPYNANHVFQEACDGEAILSMLVDCLDVLCSTFSISKAPVVEQALLMIGCPHQPDRILYAVFLHCLTGRADLAEDVMRDAAQNQIQRCESLTNANDDLVCQRKTKFHVSSQYLRRQAAAVSYQLELCLWLHRGGAFPMSGLGVRESTVGVRIGYVVASWGRCHEALENILKCEPDCSMDFERGRQLWSSMKIILAASREEQKSAQGTETTSGGWEFLVDCNREEATNLLRNRKCGSFLLRPNPEDHGIFTLSFRTNLTQKEEDASEVTSSKDGSEVKPTRQVRRDDVVQHAIVRLSDAGFKCGSFGPFSSLLKLLEAVSTSLPFDLLFKEPPAQGIIKEEGGQPSPNSVFIRKLSLHSKTEHYRWNASTSRRPRKKKKKKEIPPDDKDMHEIFDKNDGAFLYETEQSEAEYERLKQFGMYSQLLVLTELRKQFSAVVAAFDDKLDEISTWEESKSKDFSESYFEDSLADSVEEIGEEEMDTIASRSIRPFLSWCRAVETDIVSDILPMLSEVSKRPASSMPVSLSASATAVEAVPSQIGSNIDCGDAIIRRMIQPRSGVEFRTLRVGEAGHSAVVVLFRKSQAIAWIIKSGAEDSEVDAIARLDIMEKRRVIEQVDINAIAFEKSPDGDDHEFADSEKEIRYRFVDPWEVETLESKDAELNGASLGRQRYVPFTIGAVARACEESQRDLGGLHLLSLWSAARGGVCLTKALSSVYPPWERDAGGDLQVKNTMVSQPTTYTNSVRQHLYRNALFRRLHLPQRFLAFVQVEILDLKNLTSPGGSPSVTAYALLRLKRDASNAPLTQKARTLDSVSTEPKRINRGSGPHAPASWGSVVRFRFPLPEGVNCDGVSFDSDREALFKGAPSVLQLSVYEKKFMTNTSLGGADIPLDALSTDGQLEEWVPLRSANDEITWFARLRLTLRFELMCIESYNSVAIGNLEERCPSSALKKMKLLSRIGGAHEDSRGVQKSTSSPDMVRNYFENIVS